MEKQVLNRLRYLRQNREFLSRRELNELEKLETLYLAEKNIPYYDSRRGRVIEEKSENGEFARAHEENSDFLARTESSNLEEPEHHYSRVQRNQKKLQEEAEQNLDFKSSERARNISDERFENDSIGKVSALSARKAKKLAKKSKKSAILEEKFNKDFESEASPKKKKKHHWFRNILLFLLLVIVVMSGFFVYGYQKGVRHQGGAVKSEVFNGEKTNSGAVNILLLGADQRPKQSSDVAHTDSIMVLQLKPKDHQVKLVSFMRDTMVHVPGYSAPGMDDLKINTAYTLGEQDGHQGAELLRKTLKENFGVNCQYYALVDFSSFATAIDSLYPGGLTIDAKFATVNGQKLDAVPVPDDLANTEGKVASDRDLTADEAAALGYPDGGGTFMMIKPGKQKMNGRTLLNYARFRHDDENDFGRVKRQQQVMSTIMSGVKNPLTLFTGSSALGTARAVTETNIPNSFFLMNGLTTAFEARSGIKSYTIPGSEISYTDGYDQYGGLGLQINMTEARQKVQDLLGD